MYERPSVKSMPAASIVECLGPVQGYDGSGGDRSGLVGSAQADGPVRWIEGKI